MFIFFRFFKKSLPLGDTITCPLQYSPRPTLDWLRPGHPSVPYTCKGVCVCVYDRVVYQCVCVCSSQLLLLLLFLFISFANICCSCVLDTFSTECLLRGLPGVANVLACRRCAQLQAAVTWAGLLSAERLLWMKPLPAAPCGYCSVSSVDEEKT